MTMAHKGKLDFDKHWNTLVDEVWALLCRQSGSQENAQIINLNLSMEWKQSMNFFTYWYIYYTVN